MWALLRTGVVWSDLYYSLLHSIHLDLEPCPRTRMLNLFSGSATFFGGKPHLAATIVGQKAIVIFISLKFTAMTSIQWDNYSCLYYFNVSFLRDEYFGDISMIKFLMFIKNLNNVLRFCVIEWCCGIEKTASNQIL